ncbi:MAG: 50S ribosomal protein L29 [Propionibacteriales bacterium]|nr:50S ribosomal protein L29 [Propionibacteriales bacterium]
MSSKTLVGDLRNLSNNELTTKLGEAKEELFNLRFQAATGQLESHGRLRTVRRDIARIYTIMREQELGITEPVEAPAAGVEPTDDDEATDEETVDESTDEATDTEPTDDEATDDEATDDEATESKGGA